jgi:hypothetical protein
MGKTSATEDIRVSILPFRHEFWPEHISIADVAERRAKKNPTRSE